MNILPKLSKTIALSTLIIATGYLYAQEPALRMNAEKPKKLWIGASYSPDFCYRL